MVVRSILSVYLFSEITPKHIKKTANSAFTCRVLFIIQPTMGLKLKRET